MQLAGEISYVVFDGKKFAVNDLIDSKPIGSIYTSSGETVKTNRDYNVVILEADDGIIARFQNIPILGSQGNGGVNLVMFRKHDEDSDKRIYHVGDMVDGRKIIRISVNKDSPPSVMPNFTAYDIFGKELCRRASADATIELWYAPFEPF